MMVLTEFLWSVTRFGGAHAIIPGCVGVFVGLWRLDEKKCARDFVFATILCFACILAAKITLLTGFDFSPSGHAAISTFFYAAVGYLAATLYPSLFSIPFALGLWLIILLIAVSRFAVAGHTRLETLMGFLVGLAAFEFFRRRTHPRPVALADLLSAAPLALIAAIIVNRLMSLGFVDEDNIRAFARWLRWEIVG
jgi:membrane-associated phospholipid phosphatase